MQFRKFFKTYWPALLSGVLMGTSYIPFPPWAIGFCFAPLWWFVAKKATSSRSAFLAGWITQFVLSIIGFFWVSFVSHEFGFLPWSVSYLVLLLFACTVHMYFAVAAWAGWKLKKYLSDEWIIVLMAASIPLFESWWPTLFPWNLGYTMLWIHSPVLQWADVIGFFGLSFLLHVMSGGFALLFAKRPFSPKHALPLVAVALVLSILHLSGNAHQQARPQETETVKVLVVQANIGNVDKYLADVNQGSMNKIAEQYFFLTRQALRDNPDADLVVWPESAYPDFLDPWNLNRTYSRLLPPFLQEIQKPIVMGSYSSDPLISLGGSPTRNRIKSYNALSLMSPEGQNAATYHKSMLLAYGEYTPYSDWFPFLAKISPAGDGFGRGPGPTTIKWRDLLLGPQICYEGLYPNFTSAQAEQGAQVLINLTNDSWFGPRSEPYQHMMETAGRAVESRLPLVRSTNTGITMAIQASGEMEAQSPLDTAWSHQYLLRYQKSPAVTFYSHFGWTYPWLVLLAMIGVIFAERQKAVRKVQKSTKRKSK